MRHTRTIILGQPQLWSLVFAVNFFNLWLLFTFFLFVIVVAAVVVVVNLIYIYNSKWSWKSSSFFFLFLFLFFFCCSVSFWQYPKSHERVGKMILCCRYRCRRGNWSNPKNQSLAQSPFHLTYLSRVKDLRHELQQQQLSGKFILLPQPQFCW